MSQGDNGGSEQVQFTNRLVELKRRGCNLLVVGWGGGGAQSDACRRLFGQSDRIRRRLLVLTSDREGVIPRIPDRESPTRYRLVEHSVRTRSTATASVSTTGRQPPVTLHDIGRKAHDAIDEFEDASGCDGVDPGEIRVCVNSVSTLFDVHGELAVERFLTALCDRVVAARGMGHYHLHATRDSAEALRLAPLFDATIEVRPTLESVEHRWHFNDEEITSEWHRL